MSTLRCALDAAHTGVNTMFDWNAAAQSFNAGMMGLVALVVALVIAAAILEIKGE